MVGSNLAPVLHKCKLTLHLSEILRIFVFIVFHVQGDVCLSRYKCIGNGDRPCQKFGSRSDRCCSCWLWQGKREKRNWRLQYFLLLNGGSTTILLLQGINAIRDLSTLASKFSGERLAREPFRVYRALCFRLPAEARPLSKPVGVTVEPGHPSSKYALKMPFFEDLKCVHVIHAGFVRFRRHHAFSLKISDTTCPVCASPSEKGERWGNVTLCSRCYVFVGEQTAKALECKRVLSSYGSSSLDLIKPFQLVCSKIDKGGKIVRFLMEEDRRRF